MSDMFSRNHLILSSSSWFAASPGQYGLVLAGRACRVLQQTVVIRDIWITVFVADCRNIVARLVVRLRSRSRQYSAASESAHRAHRAALLG